MAIVKYNDNAASQNDRWFLNARSVHQLVGGRFAIISEYFKAHEEEIAAENAEYGLKEIANRKQGKIEDVIVVPETVE